MKRRKLSREQLKAIFAKQSQNISERDNIDFFIPSGQIKTGIVEKKKYNKYNVISGGKRISVNKKDIIK